MSNNDIRRVSLQRVVGVTLVSVLAASCVGDNRDIGATESVAQPIVAVSVVPGYKHSLAKSRFAIGDKRVGRSEFGFEKTIGSHGVFAILSSSGWAAGVPNADSPARALPALSKSPDVHNKAVRAYFTQAGLPEDQIGFLNAMAAMHMLPPGPDGIQSSPVFERYTSVISRAIDGIPIADSFAWAIINSNNEVVQESVYWPDIPTSVVADALALNTVLADPAQRSAYKAKLPKLNREGQVVIHHTPNVGGVAEAKATYDVVERGDIGKGRQRHFDGAGNEVTLAQDVMPNVPNTGDVPCAVEVRVVAAAGHDGYETCS